METLNQQPDFKSLIIAYLSGNISPEDLKDLKDWIKLSADNTNQFNEISKVWQASAVLVPNGNYNSRRAYRALFSKMMKESTTGNKFVWGETRVSSFLKIAAVLLFMLFIGGISSYFITKSVYSSKSPGIVLFEAPIGSRAIATLPDGTQVWLNAGSKLEYSSEYNNKLREVKLVGEGFFKVKTNPSKPFLVKTSELIIKATGTAFNVKAYPGEKLVTTTLVEGKVELKGIGTHKQSFSYWMKPKQKVTYFSDNRLFEETHHIDANAKAVLTKHSIAKKEKIELPLLEMAPIIANTDVRTELYTSWKDERWIIESEKLGDLAVLFERRFNVAIEFDNKEIKNYRFSATIQNETIEQIFDIMRFALPISYVAQKGKITLKTDKKLKNIYRSAYQKE